MLLFVLITVRKIVDVQNSCFYLGIDPVKLNGLTDEEFYKLVEGAQGEALKSYDPAKFHGQDIQVRSENFNTYSNIVEACDTLKKRRESINASKSNGTMSDLRHILANHRIQRLLAKLEAKPDPDITAKIVNLLDLRAIEASGTLKALKDLGCLTDEIALAVSERLPFDNAFGYEVANYLIINGYARTTKHHVGISKPELAISDQVFINIMSSMRLKTVDPAQADPTSLGVDVALRALILNGGFDGDVGAQHLEHVLNVFGVDRDRTSPRLKAEEYPAAIRMLQDLGLIDTHGQIRNVDLGLQH